MKPFSVWNSGGGCMIADLDTKTRSLSVSDECLAILPEGMTCGEYWDLEDQTEVKAELFWLDESTKVVKLYTCLKEFGLEDYMAVIYKQWKELQV